MSEIETPTTVDPSERFRKVAGFRANAALERIEQLTRTADRTRYQYSEEQVGRIVGTLRQALDRLEAAYSANGEQKPRIEL